MGEEQYIGKWMVEVERRVQYVGSEKTLKQDMGVGCREWAVETRIWGSGNGSGT